MARTTLTNILSTMLPLLFFLFALAAAQTPQIYTDSSKYKYQGCYNETTNLPGTAGDRALSDGANQVLMGNMTVPLCLSFCSKGTDKEYKYAGIEYSRECWCSSHISSLSAKYADSDCNMTCDGNDKMICGGSMKLSVYMIESGSAHVAAAAWGLVFTAGLAVYML
ncbi:putative fungistatic metabolite [Colletotrichum orbiculare MAFF 240422]|uniref:Fungistatic metabolite n=1 Tax=Colletotrichum orbiculare (strain 104-T / ATCC 96160 / CBS 514.97 / LARS 414 / MAFF 240422) TaxID=1213857 RepID=N4W289_COLOR|nr:putative fungistatic metabolite [Colletotrichum orbiculare MAFF 240422]